jgi:neurotransmitter:Na+ symporter, NSS family
MSQPNQPRENWGSRVGFILAAAGSAIGLGNIWKFPYIAGEHGGAAFIFIYLICIGIIGLPVLVAEVLIGRTGKKNPVGSFKKLSNSKIWSSVGAMGVVAGFLILSYYIVIAGWSVGYIVEAAKGTFYEFNQSNTSSAYFESLTQNTVWSIGFMILFLLLTMSFVYFGIQKGIERGSKIMMPVLLILLIISAIKGISLPGSEKGISFLLEPNWELVNAQSILVALGHAFFTLSLGMGAMMTYGSYLNKESNIFGSSLQIVLLDTLIALIAGLAIFTAVFATQQDPSAGPGLIFHTLPVVFTKMPGGYIFSILFFLLLSIAALTSAISLLEVVVSYFVDEKGWTRHSAVIVFGGVTFVIGIPSALSFNILSDFHIFGLNFFDLADFLTSNLMLPLGGMLISIFVAWVWGFDKSLKELKLGAETLFDNYPIVITFWKIFVKYFAPILIFLVLLNSLGVL